MSKTALRKTIKGLDANQLRELVMDLYEAKCDTRYYLDFFVNPDIDARMEAAKIAVSKELKRAGRGYSKARISVVKKGIASITCLQPGVEYCMEIMLFSLEMLCLSGHIFAFRDGLVKSTCRLLNDTIVYADRNQLLASCLPRLEKAIEDIPSPYYRRSFLKQSLTDQLQTTLSTLADGAMKSRRSNP